MAGTTSTVHFASVVVAIGLSIVMPVLFLIAFPPFDLPLPCPCDCADVRCGMIMYVLLFCFVARTEECPNVVAWEMRCSKLHILLRCSMSSH